MKDTIYRDDAVALVIKAIHGTDNKEIQNYLMDGLRKQMWSLPSAEPSLKAIKRQIDEHWYLDPPSADATFCKRQLITCNRVKECNGVCPFEDALKHADKTQTMNEQHTVDHDRDWIIGCIKHDGFIKTDRFDKANQIILDALSAEAEWIPVSKKLPSEGQVVLAIGDKGTWDVGQFKGTAEWTDDERMWWWKNKSTKRVEYWMPKDEIPLPHREDGEE